MPWAKLDDGFYDNPKLVAAGLPATGLYARAISYCARHMTDGLLPAVIALQLADGTTEPIDALVEEGLWKKKGESYVMPTFLDYNRSRAEALATKKERAEAGRRGGTASAKARQQAKDEAQSKQELEPLLEPCLNPVPSRPVPSNTQSNKERDLLLRKQLSKSRSLDSERDGDNNNGAIKENEGRAKPEGSAQPPTSPVVQNDQPGDAARSLTPTRKGRDERKGATPQSLGAAVAGLKRGAKGGGR